MGDFTVQAIPFASGASISSAGPDSLGELMDFAATTGFGGSAWPVANKALFIPFYLHKTTTIKQIAWQNGTTVSGNVDVGIYDTAGTRLVSAGSTAQTGTSAIQIVDITDTTLKPGTYFMAMAMDNTTGLMFRSNDLKAQLLQVSGMQEAATSFPLPSTVTYANPAAAYLPLVNLLLAATA